MKLVTWARSLGDAQRAGGTYGVGLAPLLREQGIEVWEINRPDHAKRRFQGKSNLTDTESAARTVFSGNATASPKSQSGVAEALLMLSVARRSAVKAKTQTINQLRLLLISTPNDLRERLWKTKPEQYVTNCARIRRAEGSVLPKTLTAIRSGPYMSKCSSRQMKRAMCISAHCSFKLFQLLATNSR